MKTTPKPVTLGTAEPVGNYIARRCEAAGESLTLPRLEALLYHLQGLCLSLYGTPAWDEEIGVSDAGPVIASVAQCCTMANRTLPLPELPRHLTDLVNTVMQAYGHRSTGDLQRGILAQPHWAQSKGDNRLDLAALRAYYSGGLAPA